MVDIATGNAYETETAVGLASTSFTTVGTTQSVEVRTVGGEVPSVAQVRLNVLEPTKERAPTNVAVSVVGVIPYDEVKFYVDANLVWIEYADNDGAINQLSIPIPADTMAGTHTIKAEVIGTGFDTGTFTLQYDPLPVPDDTPDEPPVYIPGSDGAWVFQDLDPMGIGSWVLPYNPEAMTAPHFERTLNVRHTTSVNNGQYTVAEGAFVGRPWKISGTYLSQDYYDQLLAYASLRRRFYIVDHRQRGWQVGVVSFQTEPKRYPEWQGKWMMDLLIFERTPRITL